MKNTITDKTMCSNEHELVFCSDPTCSVLTLHTQHTESCQCFGRSSGFHSATCSLIKKTTACIEKLQSEEAINPYLQIVGTFIKTIERSRQNMFRDKRKKKEENDIKKALEESQVKT